MVSDLLITAIVIGIVYYFSLRLQASDSPSNPNDKEFNFELKPGYTPLAFEGLQLQQDLNGIHVKDVKVALPTSVVEGLKIYSKSLLGLVGLQVYARADHVDLKSWDIPRLTLKLSETDHCVSLDQSDLQIEVKSIELGVEFWHWLASRPSAGCTAYMN